MAVAYLLSFIVLLFISPLALSAPTSRPYSAPKSRFYLRNVKAAHYSIENPVNPALFGRVRDVVAKPGELNPGVHPRIVTSRKEWEELISRHADPNTFDKDGTWSKSFLRLSRGNGPDSPFVAKIAALETTGETKVFTGKHPNDFSNEAAYDSYRKSLKPLADNIKESNELHSHSLFLCAFWAYVSEKQGASGFLERNIMKKCINASVAWAKVLMAHRTYHCNPKCTATSMDTERSYLWNYETMWTVNHDWYLVGSSLALAYDVMYGKMTGEQREFVRSAISLLVLKRWTWGTADENSVANPNAETHPHRIFSNWATYHSNLYLTNLAIEGENGFISYAQKVLQDNDATGFNAKLNRKFDAIYNAFMEHSIYPDGSTFEDGYTYHIALREGGLGILASHKRGKNNLIATPRFRNMIHNVAQQWEPWQCGELIGHASGGGLSYPSYVGFLRYAYPDGVLPRMVWAQRFGKNFLNTAECRIWWTQTMTQLAVFGDEHLDPYEKIVDSPETLPLSVKPSFPLAYVATRRGLIIARGSYSQRTAYLHFDARPDSMFPGHDNADRGVITFSALQKRWLDDLPWADNIESRKHSLLHIDGLAQAKKAPSATILKVVDTPDSCIASADLSYTYNVHWAPAWQGPNIGTGTIKEFAPDGSFKLKTYKFTDREPNSPWDLGWPMEDDATDIGFYRGMNLNPLPDIGFAGTNEWRRHFRGQDLSSYIRSTIMVRSKKNNIGFAVLVDNVDAGPGTHTFESYLILHKAVAVDGSSKCNGGRCKLTLKSGGAERVDLHVLSRNKNLSYREETFERNKRLILKTSGSSSEEIWVALHPHMGSPNGFEMIRESGGEVKFMYEGEHRRFRVSASDHTVLDLNGGSNSQTHTPSTNSDVVEQSNETPVASPRISTPAGTITATPEPSLDAVPNTAAPSGAISATQEMSAKPSISMRPMARPSTQVAEPVLDLDTAPDPSIISESPAEPSVRPSPLVSAPESLIVEDVSFNRPAVAKPDMSKDVGHEPEDPLEPPTPDATTLPAAKSDNEERAPGGPPQTPSPIPDNKVAAPEGLSEATKGIPMKPLPLGIGAWQRISHEMLLATDRSRFFTETSAPYQIVFKFTSERAGPYGDRFQTCRGYTNAQTRMNVFDCGGGTIGYQNYMHKRCNLVVSSDETDMCTGPDGKRKTDFRRELVGGKEYYLVVDVLERPRGEPHFLIGHKYFWLGRK